MAVSARRICDSEMRKKRERGDLAGGDTII